MKYKFNHKTLSFEKDSRTSGQRILTVTTHLISGVAFTVVVLIVWNLFFESPKEKRLKREITEYNVKVKALDKQIDFLSEVVKGLNEKDRTLYRCILQASPEENNNDLDYFNDYGLNKDISNSEALARLEVKTDMLTLDCQNQLQSYQKLWALAQQKENIFASVPAISPVKNPTIVSGFGMRYHPIYKILRRHTGIDITGKKGTPIYATADGIVGSYKNRYSGYGVMIAIDHGNGYRTVYAHLSKKLVKNGQHVKRGEVIGLMGTTGLSTGIHLHYEVIKDGKEVNPVHYISSDLTPEEYNVILEQASEINQALS